MPQLGLTRGPYRTYFLNVRPFGAAPQTRSPRLFPRDRGLRSAHSRFSDAPRRDSFTLSHQVECAPSAPTSENLSCGTLRPGTAPQVRCLSVRHSDGCSPHRTQLPSAAQRFDEDCRRAPARPAINGGTVCGGRDGLRHAGPRGPGRPRLAARCGRLHDGGLSAGGGGIPRRGPDGSGNGRRLARAARAAHRHDDGAAAHVPAPGSLRGTALPPPADAQLLVLAGLVGAAGPGITARSAARARLALARRTSCPGAGPGAREPAARGRGPAGAVPARLPGVSRQGLGAVGPAHGSADRRSDAGHRGRPLRRHGSGTPGDVRAGRAAAVVRADALSQRAAAAQGAAVLAGAGARGHGPLRRGAAPVPGGASGRPGLHGHLRAARGDLRGRRVRRHGRPRGDHAHRCRPGHPGRPGRRRPAVRRRGP